MVRMRVEVDRVDGVKGCMERAVKGGMKRCEGLCGTRHEKRYGMKGDTEWSVGDAA